MRNCAPLCIGVLAKWPQAGRAKTRLIPLLGPEGAAEAAMQLLLRTLRWIDDGPADIPAVLWTDGGQAADWQALLAGLKNPGRWTLLPQPAGHLGERMLLAMDHQLQRADGALLMGTDTPTLGWPHIRQVQDALRSHDAAFVPALDGGYVMVGMRRLCGSAFGPLDWGTAAVAGQTRRALQAAGCSQAWLAPEPDIDEPADWQRALDAGWI